MKKQLVDKQPYSNILLFSLCSQINNHCTSCCW